MYKRPYRDDSKDFKRGLQLSLLAHVVTALIAGYGLNNNLNKFEAKSEVFSVTLEGGSRLGGISQVPTEEFKKTAVPLDNAGETADQDSDKTTTDKSEKENKVEKKLEKTEAINDVVKELEKKKAEEEKIKEAKKLEQEKIKLEKIKLEKEKAEKDKAEKEKAEKEKKAAEEKKKKEQDEKLKKEEEEKKQADKKLADELKKKEDEKKQADKSKAEKLAKEEREKRLLSAIKNANSYKGESANAGGDGFGAARLGGTGMGGGRLESAEFIAYLTEIQRIIKGNWRWIGGTDKLVCTVILELLPSGNIKDARIGQSSGNSTFDDKAISAVLKSSPLPLPPESIYEKFKLTEIIFDSQERRN